MNNYNYNAKYKAEVEKFGKRDGLFAILLFVVYCAGGVALGMVWRVWPSPYSGPVFGIIMAGICLLFVLLRKERLSSIGFHTENLWPALRLGLFFGAIALLLGNGLVPGLLFGRELQLVSLILLFMLRTFILAAHEDMIFVGYIQTRLYGLIKHDTPAILAGALFFSLMHIMPQLGLMGFGAFNLDNLLWLLFLIPMHIVFNALFRRYYSIYPTIILHTLGNGAGHLWRASEPDFWWSGGVIYLIAIVLAAALWTLYLRKRPAS